MHLDKEVKKDFFKKFGNSDKDSGNAEAQIAMFTHKIEHLTKHLKSNKKDFNEKEEEVFNTLNLGNKAVSFTISMSIKDWHKVLIGRLSGSGVEDELIATQPFIIINIIKP